MPVVRRSLLHAMMSIVLPLAACSQAPEPEARKSERYEDLVALFQEWRAFQQPQMKNGVPDYTADAMRAQRETLPRFQERLAAIDHRGWPVGEQIDHHLVRAEMNGLEFDHRVLRPWARNPCFYAVVQASESDVPAREGPVMAGGIELWQLAFPLEGNALEDFRTRLRAIPAILDQARTNLVEDARDLWFLGARVKRQERETLATMAATLETHHPDLVEDARRAERAADDFRAWLEERHQTMKAPSGVGVEHYNWYLKNVHLLDFTWQEQVALMERELSRALAFLALSEHRNRQEPDHAVVASAEEHGRRFNEAVSEYMTFLREQQVLSVADYMDAALRARIGRFSPPDRPREFFTEVDYRDPLVMRTHGFHWFDKARMAREPHASPIRRVPLLYNIWDARAEGLATGMEEMMMHAGLFDGRPRARELIYVLLAQRAARALGDLRMHSHEFTVEQAVKFASEWTPRGWLREDGRTVWGEQQLYLEQPAYGTSYLIGKIEIERLLGERARQLGSRFTLAGFMDDFQASGVIPLSLIRWEMTGQGEEIRRLTIDD